MVHQSKKGKAELFSTHCLRRVMQGHSFWLTVRLNMDLGVRFLFTTPNDCALRPLVKRFYWLANQSHVFRGLNPHKRRFRKEQTVIKKLVQQWEIESWFRRRKTWSPCLPSSPPLPLYPVSSTWPTVEIFVWSKRTPG